MPLSFVDPHGLCLVDPEQVCRDDYNNGIRAQEAFKASQLEDLEDEAIAFYNRLFDVAEDQYAATKDLINESKENQLEVCNDIDRSTITGTVLYGSCISAVEVETRVALGAALGANRLAVAAIGGVVAAHHAARLVGIEGADQLTREVLRDNLRDCLQNAREG